MRTTSSRPSLPPLQGQTDLSSLPSPFSVAWRPSPAFLLLAVAAGLGIVGGALTAEVHPLAGFGLLGVLALGLLALQDRLMALALTLGILYLLPFAVVPIGFLGGLRPTFLDAALTLLLLTVLFRQLQRADEGLVLTPLAAPTVLFLGLALTSLVLGVESVRGETIRFFLKAINSVLFYFTVVNILRTRRDLEVAFRALTLLGMAAAGSGLLLYLLSPEPANRFLNLLGVVGYPRGDVLRYIAGTEVLRAIGTAVDPNVFGGMLFLVLPFLLAQVLGETALLPRRWLALGLALVVLALLLTYSRSSWIGAVGAVLVVTAMRYRRAAWGLGLFLLLLLFLPQGELFVERFQAGLAFEDRAALMRLGEYRDAVSLIQAHPWFGVGFGEAPDVDLYVAVASIYLLVAEQMGLVGLSAFLLLLGVFLSWTLSIRRRMVDSGLKALQLASLASVAGALTAGFFDHYFMNLQFPHTVAIFWLFLGLTAAATHLGEGTGSQAASAEEKGP